MTLEEAQEQILNLQDEVATLNDERETLIQNNDNLTEQVENLRAQNQRYYNKLIAQDKTDDDNKGNEDEEIPTCEEFAKTINL